MSLWAHWPLLGGSLADASGHGRDLAVVSGGLAGPASSGVHDPGGGGSRLFGPHQMADGGGPDQPYHGLVSPNLPSCPTWTWEAWVRLNSLPASNHGYAIMQQRPGSNAWLWVAADQFGASTGHLWTYNGASRVSVGVLSVGVWTHVGLSYDGIDGRFWFDGVPEAPMAGGHIPLSGSGFPLRLGYDETDAHVSAFCDKVLDGYLADVKMWDSFVPPVPPSGWTVGWIG